MEKYQYVGEGPTPPLSIKFMGKIRFQLKGAYVEVEDEKILQKIAGNKSFKLKTAKKTAKKKAPKKAVDSGDDNGSS